MRSVLYRDLHYTGRTLYLADRGKKLRADELYSLTPPVELLVVVKEIIMFPLLKI